MQNNDYNNYYNNHMNNYMNNYMQMAGMPNTYQMAYMANIANMTEQQLENMYPNSYKVVMPVIENKCNQLDMNSGPYSVPSKEDIDKMADDITKEVEADVEKAIIKDSTNAERQFGFGGRHLLRDFVSVLLLRELIRRRRRPFYGFPGYVGYGGFGGYGGFPYYY